MRKSVGSFLIVISISPALLSGAARLLDWIGRYQVAAWLHGQIVPVSEFLSEQPAIWFYGALATLAAVGLSLHVPSKWWDALGRRLHLLPANGDLKDYLQTLPGASFALITRLSTQGVVRRKYFFSYPAHNNGEVSLFVSADNRVVFLVRDEYGEDHSIYLEIDPSIVPYSEWVSLYVALGIAPSYSLMSIWLNGECKSKRRLNFPIRLHDVHFGSGVIGASLDKDRHGRLALSEFVARESTLSEKEYSELNEYFDGKLKAAN